MKLRTAAITGLGLLLCISWTYRAEALLQRRLLKAVSRGCAPLGDIGFHVLRLQDGKTLAAHQADRLFVAASNVKLLTTAAALRVLGPQYRFTTRLYATGPLAAGRLHGNLVLKGFGDPELVSERLWLLVSALRRLGLREVAGDLVIDESYFDRQLRAPAWGGKLSTRAFYAPIAPASLNFNAVAVHVGPGGAPGLPARVKLEPDTAYLRLENRAQTGPSRSLLRLKVDRRSGRRTNTILVSGSIPFDGTTQIYYRSITEPWRYLATALAEELRRQGVVLRGRLREGVVPQGAEEILVFESKPLARIVQDLNKMSNNFVAEMILKTMGAQVFGPPGTFDKGLSVVRRELSSMGLRPGTYQLVDGSGLSESNRLSPRQLTTVLKAMWQDFSLRPEYVVSLAVMGLDGSVEERLAQSPARQRLRVKTGHLKGVSALSGYAVAADGIELAFSILVNNSTCGRRQMERIQDQAALIITGTPASRKEKP